MYKITHNIIDCSEKETMSKAEKAKMPYAFKLYDDDGELYFKGYSSSHATESAFDPLDGIGADYGCTYIEYRRNGKSGPWDTL